MGYRVAIWDNRCVYHAPTFDAVGSRDGWRVLSIGERPFLDPNSKSRSQALAEQAPKTSGETLSPKVPDATDRADDVQAVLTNGHHSSKAQNK
jgi:hypothetical protein